MNGTPAPLVEQWIAIDPDGEVSAYVGKVDLGTGIRTAFAQIVADELDVPLECVTVIEGRTGLTPDQGLTVGSKSIELGAPPLRAAAATARSLLLHRASEALGVAVERLTARRGVVCALPGAGAVRATVTYGELAAGGFAVPVDPAAVPRRGSARRWAGTSVARSDVPAKSSGAYVYVQDVVVPEMLHARAVRPPVAGARPESVDEESLRGFPDVRVVRSGDHVAVVGRDQWRTVDAASALAVGWSGGGLPDEATLFERLRASANETYVLRDGTGAFEALASDVTLAAEYRSPFQSHASIGPPCAVADVRAADATVWSPSQGVYPLRARLAAALGFDEDAVRVVYVEGSGCFGDNGSDACALEAAMISRAAGAPVRLQWSLADQLAGEPKGPAMISTLRAAVRDGGIAAWEHDVWTPPHLHVRGAAQRALPGAAAGDRNAVADYAFPQRVVVRVAADADLDVSAFRSLGAAHNVFANESFVDELAFAAGADPLAFRLEHLIDPRAREILERAGELAAWRAGEHAWWYGDLRCAHGIAFARYGNDGTYVAAVATCAVDPASGAVGVREIAIAHDCGAIVNPDGVRNQIEGNAVQATSRALFESVRYDRERVTSTDWDAYRIARFPDAPAVRIATIDRPELPSTGAGEPATIVVAPAIANAVFTATGVRLREIPFTPARYRAAAHAAPLAVEGGAR